MPRPLPRSLTTPLALLTLALLSGLAVAGAVLWLALAQPWLGVRLAPGTDQAGVMVAGIAPGGPAAQAGLRTGDRLSELAGVVLEPGDLAEEPDMLESFAAYDRFLARQGALAAALRAPIGVGLRLASGEELRLAPAPWRPVATLPLAFWVQLGVGLFGFWVGGMVLGLRRGGWAETCLFLAGVSLMVSAHAAAIYSTRELALPEAQFRVLSAANHLGALGFGAAMICLFCSHPVPLIPARWRLVLAGVPLLWWLGNTLRLFPDPATGFQLPVLLALLAIAVCIGLQWRATRTDPRARAALRWFGLAVLIGAGAFVATVIVPILIGVEAALPQGLAFLFFLPIYGGLALGVARYRLFELEDWGFRILFYLGGMVLLVALDAVLILLVAVDRAPAFGLALLAVALLYLPMRDALARRLLPGARPRPEGTLFGAVTDVALAPPGISQQDRWRALLQAEFEPLRIEPAPGAPDRPRLAEDGAALDLPGVDALPALRLVWARGGRGLFSPRDLARAGEIAAMLAQASASRRAYETGVAEERARIARDMHDNIGIQLMGALHSPTAARKDALIRETLGDLRDIISNANRGDLALSDLLADLRASLGEHLSSAGIALHWQADDEGPAHLPQRHAHALRSILREAVGNAIRHSGAARVEVRVHQTAAGLELSVQDDGRGLHAAGAAQAGGGHGLANMRARAAGLGGSVHIERAASGGTRLHALLPLAGTAGERAVG
ncbi:MAG: ATP-binding protein [Gemmobacter sp.]|uniref:ATP-binding protein n=1 Tax=Gemmobacter sp. TaxID=1898957 RepID=UPI00391B3DD2